MTVRPATATATARRAARCSGTTTIRTVRDVRAWSAS
jgi:hypothetical protein